MVWRYLVPGIAVAAQLAAAQCSGKTTISTAAQATALASCSTYNGDIWIAKETTDDIALDGIGTLKGSLLANNVKKMTSLSAERLQSISDTFGLKDLTSLTNLNFPSLTEVDTILWEGLPTLSSLSFTQSVQEANILSIQNTGLASLDGIDLMKIEQLFIANNFFLDDVSMQLKTVSTALGMAANGRNLKVSFPNLEEAYNMTFRNVSQLSIPSLASINGTLGFYSNFFQTISAPNLTTVGSNLVAVSNGALTDINMPELKALGGALQLANNTKLANIDGFPRLSEVFGAVQVFGHFKSLSLPKLSLVKGAFDLESTENIQSTCNKFKAISGPNADIRGKFTCDSGQKNVPGEVSGGGSSSSGSGNGAGSLIIPYATGIIGIVAAVFGML